MNRAALRPPVLAAALLRISLARGLVRDTILGDFCEEFNQRTRSGSRRAASLWYWRQAFGLSARSLFARIRPPSDATDTDVSITRGSLFDELVIDLRYGARQLARRPAFTVVVVLTLAVGIGPNVAIFSVLKGLVLRQLPYPEPERVVAVWETEIDFRGYMPLTAPDYFELRESNGSFDELGVYEPYWFNLSDGGVPIRVRGVASTASLLRALGVEPALGRLFTDDAEVPGNHRVVILSDGFWKRRYAADPAIVGRQLTINGEPFAVIGVMPEEFEIVDAWSGSSRPDIHLPLVLPRGGELRGMHWLLALGRLAPDIPVEAAEADLRAIASRLATDHPATNARTQVWIDPVLRSSLGGVSRTLVFLLVMVGMLLMIACANVAAMLLARGTYRAAELAVRATLGAGRRRLARQLLTESMLLSLLAGVVSVISAVWGLEILKNLIPGRIPRVEGIHIDGSVLLFALIIASITGGLFGLAPALFASRTDLAGALKEGLGIDSGWRSRSKKLRLLLAVQLALALALVNAAALLVISYRNVVATPLGFDGEQVLLAGIHTEGATYEAPESRRAFWLELTERVQDLPGVEVATATTKLPLQGGNNGFAVAADAPDDAGERGVWVEYSWTLPGYLEAMRIPVIEGRTLTQTDLDPATSRPGAELQVVVNRALVQQFWPGESALGRRFRQNGSPAAWTAVVVGVVENVRQFGLERSPIAEVYFPYVPVTRRSTYLVARTDGDPNALAPLVREIVTAIDPNLAVNTVSMGDIVQAVTESRRFSMLLVTLFAGTALVLVAAGTYGIMSYTMSQRVHEVGVRAALGADRSRLLLFFLGQGMRFASWGLALGIFWALWAATITSNRVYGVNPYNPWLILGGAIFMFAVTVAASVVPVVRASRVDPVQALRAE